MDIGGKPMIQHVVERVYRIRGVDDVVLAVPCDDWRDFVGLCGHVSGAAGVAADDVLGRFVNVAGIYPECDTIVRVTGDCPLLDPEIASNVLQLFQRSRAWYAWNVYPGYIDGTDVEVFRRECLMRAHVEATDPEDREHVTSFVRRHYPVVTLKPTKPGGRKTSVDTLEDLEYVRSIYGKISGVESC